MFSENVVEIIKNAIKNGADIVTDTQMARSGINKTSCVIRRRGALFYVRRGRCKAVKENGTTRAVASMEKRQNLKRRDFAVEMHRPHL